MRDWLRIGILLMLTEEEGDEDLGENCVVLRN